MTATPTPKTYLMTKPSVPAITSSLSAAHGCEVKQLTPWINSEQR
ncbi:hypothetical protein [Trichocoleus sp. FACHB-262]|nr:hypothetical protein [Trichocoleus sp. FACHB-262]